MEKEILINLNSVKKVKEFINKVSKFNPKEISLDLISGRYIVDAQSIMGIFSLDLSKNITLRILTNNENLIDKLKKEIDIYIVK